MNRRRYLSIAWIPLLSGVAGCLDAVGDRNPEGSGGDAEGETDPGTESEAGTGDGTETDVTPGSETYGASDSARDVRIVVRNSASEGATVRLTVTTDGTVFFEDEVGVPQTGSRSVAPGIDETGSYELEVAVEGGPDGSYPFSVGEYDLRMGSNLIVVTDEDGVSIVMEE